LVRNQQLVQQHLHKLLLIYQGITAGIKHYSLPAVAAATVAGFVQLKHC
jgi:hypothetical protein